MPKKVKSDAIFSDGEESGDEVTLKVNKKFARRYEERQREEDITRARDRGLLDDDDSSASEEDEVGKALTPALDSDIITTLAMIRAKDKRIYDPNFKPFSKPETEGDDDYNDDESSEGEEKKKEEKSVVRYKDLVRRQAIDMSKGQVDDSDEEDLGHRGARDSNLKRIAYNEEQQRLKEAFIKSAVEDDAANEAKEETDSDDDDLLVKKSKTKKEREQEESEYRSYAKELERRAKQKKTVAESTLDTIFKEAPKDENEKFLWDYVLQKKWVGIGQSDDEDEDEDGEDIERDLEQVEKEEEFERKFNFRFEEPGAANIVTHAREIGDSMRRKDDSRKRARAARKARKQEETKKRIEELKRLKNLKKQELLSRAERIVKVAGVKENNQRGAKTKEQLMAELEGDFDPEEWDKKMAEIYNDEYYEDEDEELDVAKLRAEVDEMDEDNVEASKEDNDDGVGASKEDNNDEADVKSDDVSSKKRRRRRRKAGEEHDEDILDEAALEELYDVHYEDVAGGQKLRFNYSSVPKNDFGLTAEEILYADEKDLNELVSLKSIAPYREDEWRVGMKQRKRFRQRLKKKLEAMEKQTANPTEGNEKSSKRRSKKSKKRVHDGDVSSSVGNSKKKAKKVSIESSRMASYGL